MKSNGSLIEFSKLGQNHMMLSRGYFGLMLNRYRFLYVEDAPHCTSQWFYRINWQKINDVAFFRHKNPKISSLHQNNLQKNVFASTKNWWSHLLSNGVTSVEYHFQTADSRPPTDSKLDIAWLQSKPFGFRYDMRYLTFKTPSKNK